MDSTPPPRKRPLEVPALPGFTRASTSTSSTASSPMVTTTKTAEGYRIDALPESFPRLSSVGATLVAKMTVPELCQLFAKFLDTPLTGPGVERIIQVYLPARDQATFHEMWTHKHLKGKANTSGSAPLTRRTDQLGAMLKVPETVDSREATLPLLQTTGLCPGPYGHSPLILQRWYQYLGAFRSQRTAEVDCLHC